MNFIPKKKLGFGLMRLPLLDPKDPAKVDVEQVKQMADLFIENGFTYFDTAVFYHNSASEPLAKTVLADRYPRESYTLATKLHCGVVNSREDCEALFRGQLAKTGAGFFDYYLLHGIEEGLLPKYEALDAFAFVFEKKAQGLAKHVGFSFHGTADLLERLLTDYPQMEFVQLQLNYLDWESEWVQARACYETAQRHGKPVVVMEPVKGGTLANVPKAAEALFLQADPSASVASWALRFAAGLSDVMMVLSGMSDLAQMRENIKTFENPAPLTEEQRQICFRAAEMINAQTAVPCTGCSYCTGGCPQNIPIPQLFSLYNEDMREDLEKKGWTFTPGRYQSLTESRGKAGDCMECGQCESICPQQLPIMEHLKDVAAHFEMSDI